MHRKLAGSRRDCQDGLRHAKLPRRALISFSVSACSVSRSLSAAADARALCSPVRSRAHYTRFCSMHLSALALAALAGCALAHSPAEVGPHRLEKRASTGSATIITTCTKPNTWAITVSYAGRRG